MGNCCFPGIPANTVAGDGFGTSLYKNCKSMSSIWNGNLSLLSSKASPICWLVNAYDERCQYLLKQNKNKDKKKHKTSALFLFFDFIISPYILSDAVIAVLS